MIILHIEDDQDDVLLVASALRNIRPGVRIVAVPSVADAQAYLQRQAPYANPAHFPLPDLILLDLKLPGLDGFEFLAWRTRTQLGEVPVVALTNNLDPGLLQRALSMGAQRSFHKPVDFPTLTALMGEICPDPNLGTQPRPA